MKRLFASLSLPIGIIFLVILALFSSSKERKMNRKEDGKILPRKRIKKDPLWMRNAGKKKNFLKENTPFCSTVIMQEFLKWDSLTNPENRSKKRGIAR